MDGLISSRCEALTLRRAGPVGAMPEAKLAGLAGTYSGFDYGVALRDLPGTDPIENLSWATQVAIDIAADGTAAVYTRRRPIDAPPAKQDRFVATLRPLTVGEDGRPLFVAMAPRRQEGAFAQDPVGPGALLLALTVTGDGALQAERIGDRSGAMLLPRVEGAAADAYAAGEGPRVPLPESIGGILGAAPSLDAQCRVLAAWAEPAIGGKDMGRMTASQGQAATLPLFQDSNFEPVFGLPYSLTTAEERAAVWRLSRWLCPGRTGLPRYSGGAFDEAFHNERVFNEIAAALVDREESAA
jgi:hypothetical protein